MLCFIFHVLSQASSHPPVTLYWCWGKGCQRGVGGSPTLLLLLQWIGKWSSNRLVLEAETFVVGSWVILTSVIYFVESLGRGLSEGAIFWFSTIVCGVEIWVL